MNPGKVVRTYKRDENLRYGEHYKPPQWRTYFNYPNDKGSFSYAMERCVGVGKCRRNEHGTMCPSYMVTREEKHSTRGRARLLWEMLNNDALRKKGWRDECVKEALDLCLADRKSTRLNSSHRCISYAVFCLKKKKKSKEEKKPKQLQRLK